jgi:predicted nicotinamide N-methyase
MSKKNIHELNDTPKNFSQTNFFDTYPAFYKTGTAGMDYTRLNSRYMALIHNNKQIIRNSSILDLASHDGRWSFAAIKNGANKVFGIEIEDGLAKNSLENFKKYEIPSKKYSFIVGDLFEEIKKLKPKEFDVIFCFGIFYHIMNHMQLIREIKRLEPKYLILDTEVTLSKYPIIRIHQEVPPITDPLIPNDRYIVGRPSKSGIEMMLKAIGFDFQYYDWRNSGFIKTESLEEYDLKKSLLLKKALRYSVSLITNSKRKYHKHQLIRYITTKRVTMVAKNLSL